MLRVACGSRTPDERHRGSNWMWLAGWNPWVAMRIAHAVARRESGS